MLVKIYKIVNNIDDRIYIGSTTQPLYKRWNDHKKKWRNKNLTQYKSSILFDEFGYDNCKIILIVESEVNDIEDRNKLERYHIDLNKSNCVNCYMPYKTENEKYLDKLKYKNNSDIITKSIEYKNIINERNKLRVCCFKCKMELSLGCLNRHIRVKH